MISLAVSETPFWLIALPVLATLVGVVVGQLGPELLRRRAQAEGRYDFAIAALGRLIAARQGVGIQVPQEWARSPDAAAHARVEHDLSTAALTRYFDASAAARAALAELYPWSPDLRQYWDSSAINEADFDFLVGVLIERRKKPFARHPVAEDVTAAPGPAAA